MKTEWLYKTFSLAIIVVLFYLFYRVLSPFLSTIAWAMVLSITFYPLYSFLLRYVKRPWASSLITLTVILVIILGPFSFILGALVNEINDVYSSIENRGFEAISQIQNYPRLAAVVDKIGSYEIFKGIDL